MSRIRLEMLHTITIICHLKSKKEKQTNKQTNTVMKQTEEYIQMSSN